MPAQLPVARGRCGSWTRRPDMTPAAGSPPTSARFECRTADGILDTAGLDPYAPTKDPDQVIYTKTGLTAGTHTITVVVTGQKSPASAGAYALIDAFLDH